MLALHRHEQRPRTVRSYAARRGWRACGRSTYWYDAAGNLVEITDTANPTVFFDNTAVTTERRYVYDPVYRLVEATGREHVSLGATAPDDASMAWLGLPDTTQTEALRRYTESYSYDRAGNLLETDHDGGSSGSWTRTQSYADDSNRLDTVTIGSGSDSYPHDAHGNITAMPHMPTTTSGDDIQGMLWDAEDRLQRTRHGTGAGTYFVHSQYGADGRRVRKVRVRPDGSRYQETLYVGEWERFREYQGNGTTVEEEEESLHLSDDRKRFALLEVKLVDGGSPVGSPSYVTRYQLSDHLGSSSVEIGGSEELLTFEEYHPYGTTSHRGQSTSNPGWSRKRYRYTGQERDEESGLGYHWHRYYAPWLGRWTSADPAGLVDGPNRYVYAHGCPTLRRDVSGLQDHELTQEDVDEFDRFMEREKIREVEEAAADWAESQNEQQRLETWAGLGLPAVGRWIVAAGTKLDPAVKGVRDFVVHDLLGAKPPNPNAEPLHPAAAEGMAADAGTAGSKLDVWQEALPAGREEGAHMLASIAGVPENGEGAILAVLMAGGGLLLRRGRIPHGFGSRAEFGRFAGELRAGLQGAGYRDVDVLFQGSAVTGTSYRTGAPFDVGRHSDFDIALAGRSLFERAKELGVELRSSGTRTGPLSEAEIAKLGLGSLRDRLQKQAGREVNFMVFLDVGSATSRGPSLPVP